MQSDDLGAPKTKMEEEAVNAPNKETPDENANGLLAAGTTMGLVGTAGTLLTGAVCPLCVVGAPVLLGIGIFKKLRARRRSAPRVVASKEI